MEIAKVRITGVQAHLISAMEIPRGIIGATVALEFADPIWEGLTKNVMFVGAKDVTILDVQDTVPLPPEVVACINVVVKLGICGVNADGTMAIPTLWAELGPVKPAAPVDLGFDPQLPVWAQLQTKIGDLRNLGTESKENLVAAVNEVLQKSTTAGGTVKSVGGIGPDQNGDVPLDWVATKKTVGGDAVVISEQTLSNGLWKNLQMTMQPGLTYDVTFNGEVYVCEAREEEGGSVALGNDTSMSLNDYPFCILWAGGSAISGMFFRRSGISYPVTLKVTDHADFVYNKLPEGYLPEYVVKSVNGIDPDESGNVEIDALPDDAEQIAMLIEADMLPAVHDASGAILTDEEGNIVLRY